MAEDDDSGLFFTSLVTFNCTNGVTYQIVVAGYQGATGNALLELSPGPAQGFPGPVGGYSIGSPAPVITQQPSNQIVQAGATVTLSVTAINATSYQWYFAGVPVAGGNASALVISNFLASAAGNYYVMVSNAVGAVRSATVAIQIASQGNHGATNTPTTLTVDKFGDAVDLTSGNRRSGPLPSQGRGRRHRWFHPLAILQHGGGDQGGRRTQPRRTARWRFLLVHLYGTRQRLDPIRHHWQQL